jgi:hypothetical protein
MLGAAHASRRLVHSNHHGRAAGGRRLNGDRLAGPLAEDLVVPVRLPVAVGPGRCRGGRRAPALAAWQAPAAPWGAPWRAHVLATADALQHQLEALPAAATPTEHELRRSIEQAIQHHLAIAREAAWPENDKRLPVGQQFLDWWTGAPIAAAYVNLHEAEIALAQLLPGDQIKAQIPEALARLQTMDVTDPRRRAAETQLASNLSGNQLRAAFQSAVRIGLELKDQQHDRLRGFRNVVLATTAG